MTYKEYNAFCKSLPATTYVMQWGGSHVWKVGGKVFAIGGWDDGEQRAHHLQGFADRLRDAEGQARLPAGALPGLTRHEMDPELRRSRDCRTRT